MSYQMVAFDKDATRNVELNCSSCCRWIAANCPDVPQTEEYFEYDRGPVATYQHGIDANSIVALQKRISAMTKPEDIDERDWTKIKWFLDECVKLNLDFVSCSY